MLIHRAYKTELDINNAQSTLLFKHAGVARFAWNWGLSRRIKEYKLFGKSSNYIEQSRQLNSEKKLSFPWMYEVSKCAPQEALRDLEKAFANFYAKKSNHPRFKSKKDGVNKFRLTGRVTIKDNKIKLPRIGWLRLKERGYLPLNVKINSVTVKEKANRWFVSVQTEEQVNVPENKGPAIGIDLGLKSFVVGSDGLKIEAPKPLLRSLKRLRKLSKRTSRKQKGSENQKKSKFKLARLHYRICCQRSDFLHKTTNKLAKTKSIIVVEDLNVKGMVKNHNLSRAISDAGWYEFIRQLEYKTVWNGGRIIKAPQFFASTKTCSACGSVKKEISLSERTYSCDACGLIMDRDINAAQNLLSLSTGSSPGF